MVVLSFHLIFLKYWFELLIEGPLLCVVLLYLTVVGLPCCSLGLLCSDSCCLLFLGISLCKLDSTSQLRLPPAELESLQCVERQQDERHFELLPYIGIFKIFDFEIHPVFERLEDFIYQSHRAVKDWNDNPLWIDCPQPFPIYSHVVWWSLFLVVVNQSFVFIVASPNHFCCSQSQIVERQRVELGFFGRAH